MTGAAKFRAKRVAFRRRQTPHFTCFTDGVPARPRAAPPLSGASARHPPCRWGRRTGEEHGAESLACPPSPLRLPEGQRTGECLFSALMPSTARRVPPLRSYLSLQEVLIYQTLPPVGSRTLRLAFCRGASARGFAQREACGEEGVPLCSLVLSLSGEGSCPSRAPLLPLGAASRSPVRGAGARRREVFSLPWREPAGPVQQAPSCGGRAGGLRRGVSPAGVRLLASPSGPLPL